MKRFLYFVFTFLTVISMYAQPNWTPVNYTNSTTAYGIVTIDGLSAASGDKVGSFVGSECRAIGNITINAGTAYVTLIIQGEQVETVSFKVWQANTNTIFNVVFTTQTSPGNTIGSPPNYLAITATSTSNILVVTPDYRDVTSSGNITTFNVSNNASGTMNWTAISNANWITITSGSSGTNAGTINISYTANTGAARTGTITITASGATGSPKTVEVKQAATQFTVATSSNPTAGGTTTGGGIYGNGTIVTVMATPNSGYNFISWTEGSTVVSTNTSYTFTISSNRTFVANFAVINGIITSATSGNWNSASTWIGGIIPNSFNDVVIALGTSVTVNTPSNPECNNLTINGTLIGSVNLSGNLSINGSHSNGTLSVSKNVTVGTGNSFSTSSNLLFIGTSNTVLSVPATGVILGGIIINKTNNTNTIALTGGDLKTSANTTFINGIFVTGTNTFNLWVPFFGGGQGFTRVGVVGTNVSHVVGNCAKVLFNGGGPGLVTSCESRQEFPVGTLTKYKKVTLTFNPAFGLPTTPNAALTVNASDGSPGGSVGLPIQSGVATGIDVARYPNFYWTIESAPFSIGSTTPFDLELYATEFTDFDALANVRIICRYGAVSDVANDWLLLGTNNSYDNSLSESIPTIIQRGATFGLRSGGAVFTLGVKSNIFVKTAIPKQWLVLSTGAKNYNVTQLFQGNIGPLTYVAQSSNSAIVTASTLGSSLTLTPIAIGDAAISITATDISNNDHIGYSFDVNVGLTDVDDVGLPSHFILLQNYPNPFNPSTTIRFSIPSVRAEHVQPLHVLLKVFDLLGREVATLVNEEKAPGNYEVKFDGTNLPSGIYFYSMHAGNYYAAKKLVVLK